jgi:voltage-gated potassium channel
MDSSFMSHSHQPVHPRQPTRHPAPHRAVKLRAPQWLDMGLVQMLSFGAAVLMACGVGYWLFDPAIDSLEDGVWLAFTTAATVGYGDIVPTTPAAKIFAVFVVLLGYAALSLVTAAIAAVWVESAEREVEREILHELHAEVKRLRADLQALRDERRD